MSSVDLATHEWLPGTDGPRARTVVLVHGVMGWWRTWWRVGPALADPGVLEGGHTLHRDRYDDYLAVVLDFLG